MKSRLYPVPELGDWMRNGGKRQPKLLLQYSVADAVRQKESDFGLRERVSACSALWAANRGEDVDYAEYKAIGLAYASWYHLQRVNTAAHAVLTCFENRRDSQESLLIYDLGSGTGAVLWTVGLALCWLHERRLPIPAITIVAVENCVAIHNQADILWQEFRKRFPVATKIKRELQAVSWEQVQRSDTSADEVWMIASYLFDHSDRNRAGDLSHKFRGVKNRLNPSQVAIIVPPGKCDIAKTALAGSGLISSRLEDYQLPVSDPDEIWQLKELRNAWHRQARQQGIHGAEDVTGLVCWAPKEDHNPHCYHGTTNRGTNRAKGAEMRPHPYVTLDNVVLCATCGGTYAPHQHHGRAYCKFCYLSNTAAPLIALGEVQYDGCHACGEQTQVLKGIVYSYCRRCFASNTGVGPTGRR